MNETRLEVLQSTVSFAVKQSHDKDNYIFHHADSRRHIRWFLFVLFDDMAELFFGNSTWNEMKQYISQDEFTIFNGNLRIAME